MLNWRRDPDVERRIAESERRIAESEKRSQQLKKEIDLLDEKLRNFDALELRLKPGLIQSLIMGLVVAGAAPSPAAP